MEQFARVGWYFRQPCFAGEDYGESKMNSKDKLVNVVTYMVTATLCAVVISLIWALIHGLFVKEVDNTKIFEIIGPAFQTIIGGLIGWLSGLKVGANKEETSNGT
jgi:undecaprenyl pyrophosphate phosphatase UppP